MKKIDEILSFTQHRPFELPQTKWSYYQEWNNVLFLHWKVPVHLLRELVPKELEIDLFSGDAYISIVAFRMQNVRPRNLPALSFISDFGEINVRTYVVRDGRSGVFFLSIEAEKWCSTLIAKFLSGLPYAKSDIVISDCVYTSKNHSKKFDLKAAFNVGELCKEKLNLDKWLTERYCLYLESKESLFRYDIHHKEWEIKRVKLTDLDLNYKIGAFRFTNTPEFVHYSEGVKVLAWKKIKL